MKVKGFDHIYLASRNLDESLKFYRDAFGFEERDRAVINRPDGSSTTLVLTGIDGCVLEIAAAGDISKFPTQAGLFAHICLEVEDIDGLVESLRAKGMSFVQSGVMSHDFFGGFKNINLIGPGGENIELLEKLR